MKLDPRVLGPTLLVALVAFVALGLPDGVLGTVWPTLRDDFGRTQGGFGWLIGGFAAGYTTASVASGHVTDRIGVGRSLQGSVLTSCLGLVVIGVAPGWWVVVVGFALLGLGDGGIDAVLNAWVALSRGPRAMGLLHAAYGIGATLGPLLATAFVVGGESWRGPFVVVLALEVVVLVAVTRVGADYDAAETNAEVQTASAGTTGSTLLVRLMIVWFAFYVAAEVTVGQWSFSLLTEGRDVSDRVAGALVAAYWGGLTAGRLALGAFGHRIRPERVLTTATAVAIVATAVYWLDPGGLGAAALPVIGAALAVMFPIVVNRTPVYLGADRSNRIVGYQLASSSIGFVVIPSAVGLLADRHGIEVTGPVAFATMLAMAAVWLAIRREAGVSRAG